MKMACMGWMTRPGIIEDIDTRIQLQYCDTGKKMHVRALMSNAFKTFKYDHVEVSRGLGYDSETLATMIVAHQKTGKEINL